MPSDRSQLQPTDYLRVVRQRKLTILGVMLAFGAVALVLSVRQRAVYQASAEVVVRHPATASLFTGVPAQPIDPTRILQTEIRIINGPEVKAKVESRLGGRAAKIAASPIKDADVIRLTARSGDPTAAADTANAYANIFVDLKRQEAVDEVLAASREIQARISDLQGLIDTAVGPDRDALVQAQAVFRQKLGEAQVGGALNTGGARLVAIASVPDDPVSPKPARTVLWALSFGLVLGLSTAFFRDYLDDSVKSKEDLERINPGLPTIGLIPAVPGWKATEGPRLVGLTHPQSATAEAYRTLRTAIQFVDVVAPARVIQVTSPGTREGKTTTVANFGVALAQAGQRVALLCCDLRRPRLHEFFGLGCQVGLTTVLTNQAQLRAALHAVAAEPNLFVLPSGPLPPNPAELLASKRTTDLIEATLELVDVVILDCPPVLPVTDALVLSSRADATLLVCRSGATSGRHLVRAVELLRQVDAPLLGTVLNGTQGSDSYGGTYEYYAADRPLGDGIWTAGKSRLRRTKTPTERAHGRP